MSEQEDILGRFDEWLTDHGEVAALVMREWLDPVEGKDAVIFPPTYAKPQGTEAQDWIGYNIDRFDDGTSVCHIDSVGSQANRMEPIFKREPYSQLVPRVVIKAGSREVDLLDAGHRAADAIVRFSNLRADIEGAFKAFGDGDAELLAKIAPTSLVFGAWDSRVTQAKVPRIVRSVIRAYGVRVLHRSAQYSPPIDYVGEGLLDRPDSKSKQDSISELGFSHVPAPWAHGGVQVLGEIRRDASVNLVAVRALAAPKASAEQPGARSLSLRRYILGLALVSFTAPVGASLREGCQLVPCVDHPADWEIVRYDGKRERLGLSHSQALEYAQAAAQNFGVRTEMEAVSFDGEKAKKELALSKEERSRSRRGNAEPTEGES